jgi:hypothetical protein
MCYWFAPTKLVITFETEGMGAFTQDELDRYVVKDEDGTPVALDLPTKFVLIANHQVRVAPVPLAPLLTLSAIQVYADWWYAWCFTYFMSPHGIHRYVYITLKKSLRWVPIVGWVSDYFHMRLCPRSTYPAGYAILQVHFPGTIVGF